MSVVIGPARHSDPATSKAASGISPRRITNAMKVLVAYEQHPEGLTAVEVGDLLGMRYGYRRAHDLHKLGHLSLVYDNNGQPMTRNHYGQPARVLMITPRGRLALSGITYEKETDDPDSGS